MNPKSFSYILLIIVSIFAAFAAYIQYTEEGKWYIVLIPLVILIISLLVLKDPIDRWGFTFQNVQIDDKIMHMIEVEYPEVSQFDNAKKIEFRKRMFHFLRNKNAYLVGEDAEKLDLFHVILICAPAVIMNMNKKLEYGDDIERIAAYNHPFPSPKMKFIHCVEYEEEDGMVIISLEQMMFSIRLPQEYYHIIYHVWSERMLSFYPDFPTVPVEFKNQIESIYGFSQVQINSLMGYDMNNYKILALVAYFTRRRELEAVFPELSQKIKQYLQTD